MHSHRITAIYTSLDMQRHKSCLYSNREGGGKIGAVKWIRIWIVFCYLYLQVAIIEELVVGFETSLNSCRMFNQNGESNILLQHMKTFFSPYCILYMFPGVWLGDLLSFRWRKRGAPHHVTLGAVLPGTALRSDWAADACTRVHQCRNREHANTYRALPSQSQDI